MFFVELVVLDPLVVVLAAFVRQGGLWLTSGVVVLDIAYELDRVLVRLEADPARLLRPAGLLPVARLACLVSAPLLRVMKK